MRGAGCATRRPHERSSRKIVWVTPEELRIIAEELPVAIWMARAPGGEAVYSNRAFREVLGIEPPSGAPRGAFGKAYGVRQLDGSPYPEDAMPFDRVLAARATVVVDDIVIHRPDGRRVHLRVFAKPLFDDHGEITHVLEAFTDITREVESERARLEGERKLARAHRLESIGQLVAGIAHDFNNILTVTKLAVRQLLPGETDPKRRTTLADVQNVTETAIALVRNLLSFAGNTNAKIVLAPLELAPIVRSIVELAQRTFDPRVTVRLETPPDDAWIDGDRAQLEQIVMNLLVNARDAIAAEGQIVVSIRVASLSADELEGCPAGRYVVLDVTDDGSGIPPEVRDRIFEPYFTTKTFGSVRGTGLGLATVLGNVRAHRGFVEARDAPPRGTTLRIAIPRCDPLPDERHASPMQADEAATLGNGERILVIDDERLVRRATARTLTGLGYQVIEAEGGEQALKLHAENADAIDAVLLDMVMPGMSAREIYEGLRTRRSDIRVLLVTGSMMNDEIEELVSLGIRGSLPKPFDRAEVAAALHKLLQS